MALAPEAMPAKRVLVAEVWEEFRPAFKIIIVDFLVFSSILMALAGAYYGLHVLEKIGYPKDRLAVFEIAHYWAYLGVFGLFLIGLVLNMFSFIFLRRRHARQIV